MSTFIQSLKSYDEPPAPATPLHTQPQYRDVFNQIGSYTEMSQFVVSSNVEMLWNILSKIQHFILLQRWTIHVQSCASIT